MSQLFLQKMAETFEVDWTPVSDDTPVNTYHPKPSKVTTVYPKVEAVSQFLRKHKKGLVGAGIGAAALGAGAGTAAYLYNRKKKKLQQEQEQAKAALEVIDEFYEKTASKIPVRITSNGRSTKILYKENGEWKKADKDMVQKANEASRRGLKIGGAVGALAGAGAFTLATGASLARMHGKNMVDIANLSADLGIPLQITGKQILGAAATKAIKDLNTGTSIGRHNLLGSGSGAVLGGIIGSPIGAIHGYKKAIRKEIKRRHQNP